MNKDEVLLLSLSYGNYTSKILNGFFNVFILPLILFSNIAIIIAIFNYETFSQLAGPFAGGIVSLILSSVYLIISVLYILIFKRYSKLDITNETVIINDKYFYPVSEIKYQQIPSIYIFSNSFLLTNQKTNKIIAHFNYRFGDTVFFKNSPEMIKKILQTNEPFQIKQLQQEIKEDRKKVLKSRKLVKRIRIITMFSFIMLVLLLTSMFVFRALIISKDNSSYTNIDMPSKMIFPEEILKVTTLFNEQNKTK